MGVRVDELGEGVDGCVHRGGNEGVHGRVRLCMGV